MSCYYTSLFPNDRTAALQLRTVFFSFREPQWVVRHIALYIRNVLEGDTQRPWPRLLFLQSRLDPPPAQVVRRAFRAARSTTTTTTATTTTTRAVSPPPAMSLTLITGPDLFARFFSSRKPDQPFPSSPPYRDVLSPPSPPKGGIEQLSCQPPPFSPWREEMRIFPRNIPQRLGCLSNSQQENKCNETESTRHNFPTLLYLPPNGQRKSRALGGVAQLRPWVLS